MFHKSIFVKIALEPASLRENVFFKDLTKVRKIVFYKVPSVALSVDNFKILEPTLGGVPLNVVKKNCAEVHVSSAFIVQFY